MKRFFLLLLLLASASAFAQVPPGLIINGTGTATISWTIPTEYTDGSPLPASDINGYVIFYHDQSRFEADGTTVRPVCSGTPQSSRADIDCYSNAIDLSDGSQVSQALTIQLSEDTTIYFTMTSWVRTGNVFGDWSAYSAEVTKSFVLEVTDGRAPLPPTIESIDMTITCTTNIAMVTCTFDVQ